MRGEPVEAADMTGVATTNVKTFVRSVNNLKPRRVGADVGAWFSSGTSSGGNPTVEFRVPYADFKHPSAVEINPDATSDDEVFRTGKYQAIRFAPIGQRHMRENELRRHFPDADAEATARDLFERYQDEIVAEREDAFKRAVTEVASGFGGVRIDVDTGDKSFSSGRYRPHVRLYAINTGGETLGEFVDECVTAVENKVYKRFQIRGV